MFDKRDLSSYTTLDNGKCQALLEFSKIAAKEGGHPETFGDVQNPSKEYFIPMISALVGEKLVSQENEFDELMYVLQQYCPKAMHTQLNLQLAKSGNKIEVMKFFAALVYEFRVTHSAMFTRLCDAMSRLNQLQIAHFISFMDNAVRAEDFEWWRILFLPYTDEQLNGLGMSIGNNAVQTPHKTPSRNVLAEKTIFDSPVYNIVNSPSGKDRVIQEYERRLKAERNLVQTLQADYDESSAEIAKLKLEIENLKDKLDRASKNASSMCGDECPNKNEMAAMRLRMNVRENKFQQLNADLLVARQELEAASDSANEFRTKNSQLEERIKFLADENERLSNSFKEMLEMRQKLAVVIKEKEEMLIQRSTNEDLINKAKLLDTENEILKKENEELNFRISIKEENILKLKLDSEATKSEVTELKKQVDNSKQVPELEAINSKLTSENDALKKCNKDADNKFLEAQKETDELKGELEIKRRVINNLTSQLNKASNYSAFGRPKPIEEPINLLNKSLFDEDTTFFETQPAKASTPVNSFKENAPPPFKALSVPAKKEFSYDYKNRLNILREQNRKNPPHMRVHYGAFETDAPYSPTAAMKFE